MARAEWNSSSWVSLSPNGIGHTKPNHYFEIAKTVWQNRDQLPFAWRILTRGVCDGCALGTSGVHDFTMEGVHPHDLGTILDHEGVAVRTGHHCAMPLMTFLGIPATARASFGVYNTEQDVASLVAALGKAREVFG